MPKPPLLHVWSLRLFNALISGTICLLQGRLLLNDSIPTQGIFVVPFDFTPSPNISPKLFQSHTQWSGSLAGCYLRRCKCQVVAFFSDLFPALKALVNQPTSGPELFSTPGLGPWDVLWSHIHLHSACQLLDWDVLFLLLPNILIAVISDVDVQTIACQMAQGNGTQLRFFFCSSGCFSLRRWASFPTIKVLQAKWSATLI